MINMNIVVYSVRLMMIIPFRIILIIILFSRFFPYFVQDEDNELVEWTIVSRKMNATNI